jgi:hypothetical protein
MDTQESPTKGTQTNPNSIRQRVIAYLKSRPGEEITADDVMISLGVERTVTNTTLCGLRGVPGVSRVRIGTYCYDPTVPAKWVAGSNFKRKKVKAPKATEPKAVPTPEVFAVPKGYTEVGTLVKDEHGNFMVIRRIPSQAVRHLI